jgi:plastocyanin
MYPRLHFQQFFWILAIALGFNDGLWSGEIRGRVIVKHTTANPPSIMSRDLIRRYNARQPSHTNGMSHSAPEVMAVVYLNGAPDSSRATPRSPVVMDQQHKQFIPHVLPIQVGAAVRFLNSEEDYHNVFSLSRAKKFNIGRHPKGHFRDVVFNKPGLVSVYCDIHTHMNAFILVLSTRHFTNTDAEGNFRFDGIPAGTYEIRVWHPPRRKPEKAQKIVVQENEVTEVELVLP